MPGCARPSVGSASRQAGAKSQPRNQPEPHSRLFCCTATKSLDEAAFGGDIGLIVQCSKTDAAHFWSSLFPQWSIHMANANTTTSKNGFFDVTKVMGDFRVPGIDLEAAVSSRRRNIEALTQANQLALEGVQAGMPRHAQE